MNYTVDKLARLAGVTPRTLRHYDAIGLLRPDEITASGYRIYRQEQVDRLQQILFYRNVGMELRRIAELLNSPDFDRIAALRAHLAAMVARKEQTERLILTLRKTIQKELEETTMTDKEKFEGFKTDLLQQNQERYGKELEAKYGKTAIAASNAKLMKLSGEEYAKMEALGEEIQEKLEAAVREGILPDSETGREIAALHQNWLKYTWPRYQPEAHISLGEMYVADERFTAHYDQNLPGCAIFLRDAIGRWANSL